MRRTIAALAAAVIVAAAAGIVTAVPAAAEDMPAAVSWHGIKASPYVALGDSYLTHSG
jgi:hypothetical protein